MGEMPYVLGLSGKAGSGKSTVARALKRLGGDKVFVYSFADALRNELDQAFSGPRLDWRQPRLDWRQKPTPPWMRDLLIAWGMAKREAVHRDYWVYNLLDDMEAHFDIAHIKVAIVDDVRFPNECDCLRDFGNVVRLECVPPPPVVSEGPSEAALDDYDFDHVMCVQYGDLDTAVEFLYDKYIRSELVED